MRWLAAGAAAVALTGAALAGAAQAQTATTQPAPGPQVVVIGVPGLRWADVDRTSTPNLWRLAQDGAVGSLSVRSGHPRTCPADGWLTVGSGNRARTQQSHPDGCPAPTAELPVRVAGGRATVPLAASQDSNDDLYFGTELGALGSAVAQAGDCITAVGPGGAIAAADEDGRVPHYLPGPEVTRADLSGCAVGIVDVDSTLTGRTRVSLAEADRRVGDVLAATPAGTTVIVVGVSEIDDERPQLHYAAVRGPEFAAGDLLRSGTTRRSPYVQLIDVAPTVLHLLGIDEPASMVGEQVRAVGGGASSTDGRIHALVDTNRAAIDVARLVPPFFALVVATQFALYVLAGVALSRRSMGERWRRRIRRGTRVAAIVYASAPAATYLTNLYPWWRRGHPLVAVLLAEAVGVTVIAVPALLGPWRRHTMGSAGFVAAATALVLAGDILTGSRLQMSSLLGYSPIVAGRFAGFGNVAFTLFATGALLATAAVLSGRSRPTIVAGVTAAALFSVVVDGAPWFGADFGGVLAIIPAFTVLGMLLLGKRLSVTKLALSAAAAVVAVAALALIDYARPPDSRTHLGRFVAQVRDGTASTVIHRKANANLHVLAHSVLGLLVPVTVLFLALLLRRPTGALLVAFERVPALRSGLIAVLVLGVIGFAVNDSGIAIPALSMTVAIPIAIAVTLKAVEDTAAGEPAAAPAERTGASG